jgi:single-strand selective monofunctional uracil DNA glycosylase
MPHRKYSSNSRTTKRGKPPACSSISRSAGQCLATVWYSTLLSGWRRTYASARVMQGTAEPRPRVFFPVDSTTVLGVKLSRVSRELLTQVDRLRFGAPVACVYNPLAYAWDPHEQYLARYGTGQKRVLLVGMNPGPFGMVQTGVPFGDVGAVRRWLKIQGTVTRPAREHPKRPVLGFECSRSEVSGTRVWGWAEQRFGTPQKFFRDFFIHNYCPLAFVEDSGRNRTPDKLAAPEREPLFDACDLALARVVELLEPKFVIGIGTFAEQRIHQALGEEAGVTVSCILHPSPASPLANRNWAATIEAQLAEVGVELPP